MATTKTRGPRPIHPGEILLEEFLKVYDPPVSQVDAADRMHIPKVRLNQLIRGHRGVHAGHGAASGGPHGDVGGILDEPPGSVRPLARHREARAPEGCEDSAAREGQLRGFTAAGPNIRASGKLRR